MGRRKNERCVPKSVLSVRLTLADTAMVSSVDDKPTVRGEQNDPLQFENKLTWM